MHRSLGFAAAAQANHPVGSISPVPHSINVRSNPIVFLDSGLLSPANLNRLLSVSPTNLYAANGQYLAALENLRSLCLSHQPTLRRESVCIHTEIASLGKSSIKLRLRASIAYSFDEAVRIINAACNERARPSDFLEDESIVSSVVEGTKSLLRRLDRRILRVRRLVHRSVARFCALSWSRRSWYLLHGSHPPRTECRPAFGCA